MTTEQHITPESAELWGKRWKSFRAMWDQVDLRWKRLGNYIETHISLLPSTEDQSIILLRAMLDRLLDFGDQHFEFFYHGFVGNLNYTFAPVGEAAKLEPPFKQLQSEYSIGEFILSTIFDRVVFDLQVLDQAIDQRFTAITELVKNHANRNIDEASTIYAKISMADDLALGSLFLCNTFFALDDVFPALTYYRAATTMRIIPYAKVALIGLPISSFITAESILGIPHEIGHFLYWNGKKQVEDSSIPFHQWIKMKLEKDADHPWIEEIVADIVSCLIGGPVTALSMQRLMQTTVGEKFLLNDGEHPIPAIRPFIYLQVMENKIKLTGTQNLRRNWEKILNDRLVLFDTKLRFDIKTLGQLSAEYAKLYELVEKIADLINLDIDLSLAWYGKNTFPLSITDDSQLIEKFINSVKHKDSSLRQAIDRYRDNKRIAEQISSLSTTFDWPMHMSQLFGHLVPRWLYEIKLPTTQPRPEADASTTPLVTIPANEWLTVFEAGGWTSGGDGPTNFKGIM